MRKKNLTEHLKERDHLEKLSVGLHVRTVLKCMLEKRVVALWTGVL